MAHVRKQLRDAVKARLATVGSLALVADGSRLARAFQPREFPAALVAVAESAAREDTNPEGQRALRRTLQVGVRICVHAETDDAEDTFDALAVEVEKALAVSSEFGIGSLIGWAYQGATATEPQEVVDGVLLAVTLNYSCAVLTTDVDPATNLYA